MTQLPRQRPQPETTARLLGSRLRQLRVARGETLEEAAVVIRGSAAKVSRLERGITPAKARDVRDLATHYGASPEDTSEIEYLLSQAHNRAWYKQYSDVTPGFLRRLISLEQGTERIITYEAFVVPGLLQTHDYARAVVEAALPQDSANERRVALRMERKRILKQPDRPHMTALLDQGVLMRPRGGPEVMCRQLEHLLEMGHIPGINIRVIEFEHSGDVSPPYPITHLRLRDGGPPEVVYVESIDSAHYLTRPAETETYRFVLNRLMDAAADRLRSEELLRKAATRYRAMAGQSRRG
ncbi:helix-turn-helix domain-containing protein [Streptomyces montanus]|uniref:helix-turn-helix domain-containing protein n=1 Tax=Streptomyces montanus TaxID=2580423 RepID=UPI001485C7C8|nr:helix-turn-helix transcriptional regulator [Streptomyces montanus]